VICPDLPGFGGSSLPKEAFTLKEIAKLVENWLWDMNVRNPIIIGHSLGGYIALALMASEKIQMSGLGLFHSSAFGDDDAKRGLRDKTVKFIENNGVDPFIRSFVPPLFGPENRLKCKDNIENLIYTGINMPKKNLMAFTKAMRDREDNFDALKNFKGRKLMICGDNDPAVPIAISRKHKDRVDDYTELEGCGHMGMFENKAGSITAIQSFLEKV